VKVLFVVVEDKYFLIQRLNLALAVRDAGHKVVVASRKSELSQKIKDLGFEYIDTASAREGRNPLKELATILRLASIYRKLKPDLVHHISIKPVLYGSIAAKLAGVKRVVNLINGLGFVFAEDKSLKRSLFKVFISVFYKIALLGKSVKVIFQNPDDREYFVTKKLIPRNRTHVILGSGVDMDKFPYTLEPEGKVQIMFCARMIWDKGIKYLIEASKLLKEKGLDFDLNFIGAPDESNPQSVSESQLKSWDEQGLINYKGFQNNIPEIIKSHHIITLPTFYREGVPLSLIEAASIGRPIVTTDMPGCREIVKNEKNGFVVPIKDSTALANSLERLVIDKNLREQYGRESRRMVEDIFCKEVVNSKTLKVYDAFSSDK
jgi:glycosyltransferase involved in cell wall biosynthesis